METELILFDLDGTLHKLEERNFLKSPIYFEMRDRSIEFLIQRLGIDKEKKIPIALLNKIISAKAGDTIKNPTKVGKKNIKVTRRLERQAILARNLKRI